VTWVVAAVLATIAVTRLVGGAGNAATTPPVTVTDGVPGEARKAAAGGGGASARRIYVHVAGAVRRPGLFRLPEGARTAVAIERAGGPLPRAELAGVNLAAPLADGQQVVVPVRGGSPAGVGVSGAGAGGSLAAGVKPSLASATAAQLDELDGIGPTLAGRIIEYRDSHGGFRSLDELAEVDGIGETRLAALKEALAP
jgi:competence protein ComEA